MNIPVDKFTLEGQAIPNFEDTWECVDLKVIRGNKYVMFRNEQHPEALRLVLDMSGRLMCRTDADDIRDAYIKEDSWGE